MLLFVLLVMPIRLTGPKKNIALSLWAFFFNNWLISSQVFVQLLIDAWACVFSVFVLFAKRTFFLRITMQFSCAIEDFVKTRTCKLFVMLRSRVIRGVCVLTKDRGR